MNKGAFRNTTTKTAEAIQEFPPGFVNRLHGDGRIGIDGGKKKEEFRLKYAEDFLSHSEVQTERWQEFSGI